MESQQLKTGDNRPWEWWVVHYRSYHLCTCIFSFRNNSAGRLSWSLGSVMKKVSWNSIMRKMEPMTQLRDSNLGESWGSPIGVYLRWLAVSGFLLTGMILFLDNIEIKIRLKIETNLIPPYHCSNITLIITFILPLSPYLNLLMSVKMWIKSGDNYKCIINGYALDPEQRPWGWDRP